MLKNYLTIALRALRKHKAYALINLLGLACSAAASILILLYAYNVLTFDAFHAHADDLYFLYRTRPTPEGPLPVYDTWAPMLDEVKQAYPAVVGGARFLEMPQWVQHGAQRYRERVDFTDASLFTAFSFPLRRGDPETVLADPGSLVLSEAMARKYFGDADPIGQTLTLNFDRTYTVAGVLGELPPNSTFTFDLIAPLESLPFVAETGWNASYLFTFVQLAPGTEPADLEAQFPAFVDQFFRPDERGDMKLMPLADYNDALTGRRRYAYVLLAIAFGILLIAAINFTNLATARSMLRAREIGMRKVLGATRGRLVRQFLGEALLMSFLGLLLGVALAELLLPAFNGFVGMALSLGALPWPLLLAGLGSLGLAVGLLSGAYPALYLSRFRPVAILKDGLRDRPRSQALRSGLVVVQFALSILLIAGIGVMYQQIQHMKTQDLHFDAEGVLAIPVSARDFADPEAATVRIASFTNEVAALTGVRAVSMSNAVPGDYPGSFTLVRPEGQEDRQPLDWRYVVVDDRYFDTYGIRLVEGRGFSPDLATDAEEGVILNEAAARALGWDAAAATGKTLLGGGDRSYTVLGVVEDFHYQSLEQPIEPVLHFYGGPDGGAYRYLSVKLGRRDAAALLPLLHERWEAFDASRAFDYFFVDAFFAELYEEEENMARIVGYAALLALLIACLGLSGLASFAVVQRTKEIGVRKVLGASAGSIVALLARQLCKPIVLAFVLAMPAAYYLMHVWLQDFPYRIDVSPAVFVFAGGLALTVGLLTIGVQAVRAALANPVDTLRYE